MLSEIIKQDVQEIYDEYKDNLHKLEGKKILIAGANGFIPSYVADTFVKMNHYSKNPCQLILMNKNYTTEKSRLSHLIGNKNIVFCEQDLGKKFEVPENPDVILHAASRANPLSFFKEPIDTIECNVNGTRTFLEYGTKHGLDLFMFFSSSEVYGDPDLEHLPTSEKYNGNLDCNSQMACYSESKRFCETLSMGYFRKHGIPVKTPRIFHTYGPGIRNDGKTIASFFVKGIENSEITLKDVGKAKRSYSYVADTVRGLFKIWFKGDAGESYNVGDDTNNVSVKELAYKVSEVLSGDTKVNIPHEKYKDDDRIRDRYPDISKLRALGFAPKTHIEKGLRRLKDHYLEVGTQY